MDIASDSAVKDMKARKNIVMNVDKAAAVDRFDHPLSKLLRGAAKKLTSFNF